MQSGLQGRLLEMKMLSGLFKSKGYKRSISVLLFLAAQVPQLALYKELIEQIASVLGGLGVAHAVIAGEQK